MAAEWNTESDTSYTLSLQIGKVCRERVYAEPAWAFRTNSARLAELRSRGFVTSEREPADGGIITWWHPTDAGREVMAAYRKGREDDFPNGLDWVGEEL